MIVRPSRPLHSQPRLFGRSRRAALVAASVASVLLGTSASFDAFAQASGAASASAASVPVAASEAGTVTQYSVKPGQALSDIAAQITGSNDRATREKMARALFEANPNAFMGHDPSRLKLGSVLNVPSIDDAGAAAATSAGSAASSPAANAAPGVAASSALAPAASPSPAVQASSSETIAVTAGVASTAAGAAANGAVTSNVASEANAAVPTSEAQPAASVSESAPASAIASAPVSSASSAPVANVAPSAANSVPMSGNGPIGWLIGVVVAIGLLLFAMRAAKRRRAAAVIADDRGTPETSVVRTTPEAVAAVHHDSSTSRAHSPSPSATGAANLDGASVPRDQSELNVVAASMENYDAAQSFDTATEDAPRNPAKPDSIDDDAAAGAQVTLGGVENRPEGAAIPTREADVKRAPFMPDAPAALHRDFTPPRPGAIEAALAAERVATEHAAALRAEMEAREQEVREAAALEQAARETAARELEAQEAASREVAAREAETREAAAREVAARETAAREAAARETEAREAAAREAETREVAAREVEAREAEARETAAREAASQEASEHRRAPAQPSTPESAPHLATNESADLHDTSAYDDEPSPASRFPQPKFPQEAIEALSALDFGLPPRQEAPAQVQPPPPAAPAPEAEHAAKTDSKQEPQAEAAPVNPAAITPQPIADPAVFDRQNAQHRHPEAASASASEEIESGTSGAASVAGLGASRFGPLSLDFDYHSPASQTEPLPAFTPEQISTIARNKLELAVEYIELGDLSGARTLLQEVIESNDQATRQPAAKLLSTLAPLS